MIKIDNMGLLRNYSHLIKEHCPSFSGIIEGVCKGELWVDRIDGPTLAVVYSHPVGSYAIFGEIQDEQGFRRLENFLKEELFDELKHKGCNTFEFSIENEGLSPYLQAMFEDKYIQSEKEFSYRCAKPINNNLALPEGVFLQRVNCDFWNRVTTGAFSNGEFITERLLQSWGSFENFNKNSLAFCITHGNIIASVIVGTARLYNFIPIDIETDTEYQKKGLAYLLTTVFVNECYKRGLIVQWDCVESNMNSCNLVKKAGFEYFNSNTVYWFDL